MASGATSFSAYMGPGTRGTYASLPDNMKSVWQRACGGDLKAMFDLGVYFWEMGTTSEAYRWFQAGGDMWTNKSNHNCMLMLAYMHLTGCGAYYDGEIAQNYYKCALEKGEAFDARCTGALAVLQKTFSVVDAEVKEAKAKADRE